MGDEKNILLDVLNLDMTSTFVDCLFNAQTGFIEIVVAVAYNPETYSLGILAWDIACLTCLQHLNRSQGLLAVLYNELPSNGQ